VRDTHTDRQTHTHTHTGTQTAVTAIQFVLDTPRAKCRNDQIPSLVVSCLKTYSIQTFGVILLSDKIKIAFAEVTMIIIIVIMCAVSVLYF